MKTLLLTLTYLVGTGELILAWYFWKTHSGNEIRKVMAFLAFSSGMWALFNAGLGIDYQIETKFVYITGALLTTTLLLLMLVFPYRLLRLDWVLILLLYLPAIFFAYAILFTKTVLVDFYVQNNAAYTSGGELFPVYNFVLGLLFFLSLGVLLSRIPKSDGVHRQVATKLFWAVLVGGLPGVILAVFHWFRDVPFNYLYGPVASGIWLGTVTYIITRKV